MRARDIMTRPVVSVDTTSTVRDAVVLTENGFATVPVVDDEGHVVGIFSESDGLRAEGATLAPVTSAMTSPVEVTTPDAEVALVAERLLAKRLRALPVVEEGLLVGVVGIVTATDLLRLLAEE